MEEIITELSGNVLRIQFNRPSKKNAMTVAMYAALTEELDRADNNDDVRVGAVGRARHGDPSGDVPADFVNAFTKFGVILDKARGPRRRSPRTHRAVSA